MLISVAVIIAGLTGLLVQYALLVRRWRRGAPARVDLLAGLLGLPKAYLGAVHHVVSREPRVARMHVFAAGGTLAALALTLCTVVFPVTWIAPLVVLAALAGMAGAALDIVRRRINRPTRLSSGKFDIFPLILAALAMSLGLAAIHALAGEAWLGVVPVAAGLVSLGCVAWLVQNSIHGPMRHAVAGATHLVVHPRPERFDAPHGRSTGLLPLDLDSEQLGSGSIADIGWNRLVGFDSCIQCGKCEAACPANAAGQPLNPKAFINDLVRASGDGMGADYAGNSHAGHSLSALHDRPLDFLVGEDGNIAEDTLWACTTCRACVYECPMLIEHVDTIVDLRRFQTLEKAAVPAKVALTLTAVRETDTIGGKAADTRFDWAADLALPVLTERQSCDVLLWVGESAFERRNQKTLRVLVKLLRKAGVDFAVLGSEELDSGDLARRLGDEVSFQRLAAANMATLAKYSFNRIVTADPHVLHSLGKEYTALGGHYDVVHHTTYLDGLLAEGRLGAVALRSQQTLTYHDPCYLGRYSGEIDAPRRLLERLGTTIVEMEHHGMRSRCCGGGGGAPISDIEGKARISDLRVAEAVAVNATTIVAACPFCTQMLEGVAEPRPEVVDIAELLLDAIEAA